MLINLTSDTVTRPTAGMLEAMFKAEVGDDVFKADPTANQLQAYAADLFGKEDALFCPSGTMANQLAIAVHTNRLNEVICDRFSHIYQYEAGGYASNSGVAIKLIDGDYGKITPEQIAEAINPDLDWLPKSTLVVLENTCTKGGGTYYTLTEMEAIATFCHEQNLRLHLDGARLFNATVETGDDLKAIGALFDSIAVSLCKGLGAPIGSLLIGDARAMTQARRLRKAMGGGMRQIGYLAAAGLYALENHIELLREDHRRIKVLRETVQQLPFVKNVWPAPTNILFFDVVEPYTTSTFLAALSKAGHQSGCFWASDHTFCDAHGFYGRYARPYFGGAHSSFGIVSR